MPVVNSASISWGYDVKAKQWYNLTWYDIDRVVLWLWYTYLNQLEGGIWNLLRKLCDPDNSLSIPSVSGNHVECFHVVINQYDSQDCLIYLYTKNSINGIKDDYGDNVGSRQDGEMCVCEEGQIFVKEVGLSFYHLNLDTLV